MNLFRYILLFAWGLLVYNVPPAFSMGDFRLETIGTLDEIFGSEETDDLEQLLSRSRKTVIIRKAYSSDKVVHVPEGRVLYFEEGGSIRADLVFDNTLLSGNVRLQGSHVSGSIRNTSFNAGWLCCMDGVSDDAGSINEMISLCDTVYFPKGTYLLKSIYSPPAKMEKRSSIRCHIGVNRSNVSLIGEKGTVWSVPDVAGTICVFSAPGDIPNNIRNITIRNIEFKVANDGKVFHEWTHSLHCIGVNGLVVQGCHFNDFWGDAICLGHYGDNPETGELARNRNIKIIDNVITGGDHHNNRNGISVINGENVVIQRNVIKNTTRADMPGAIDVEPNNSANTIKNISILNNEIEGCSGTAGGICIHANRRGGPAHGIEIIGNTIKSSTSGLSFVVLSDNTSSNFTVKNNVVEADTRPMQFVGSGKSSNWFFSGNVFKRNAKVNVGGSIKVKGIIVENQ